jgi:hypothetical protein
VRVLLKRAVARRVWELLAAVVYTCLYSFLLLYEADTPAVYSSASAVTQCVPAQPRPTPPPPPAVRPTHLIHLIHLIHLTPAPRVGFPTGTCCQNGRAPRSSRWTKCRGG